MGLQSGTPCPAKSSSLLHKAKLLHFPSSAPEPAWADTDQGIIVLSTSAHQQIGTSLPALLWDQICNEPVGAVLTEERYWTLTDPLDFLGFKHIDHHWELRNSWQALTEETLNGIYISITSLLTAAHNVRPNTGLLYNEWLKTTVSFQKPSTV